MSNGANAKKIGKLEKGKIRVIWSKERNFSTWLADTNGLALLGETLGMELDEAEREKRVGPFFADIVCHGMGGVVVVENQYDKSDHNHLGKMIAYSAGLKAATIVWIAEEFVEEHRAALDWLNVKTVQGVRFFGLEIGLYSIGESLMAPQFRIVSRPNDWMRMGGVSVKETSPLSEWEELCREFWGEFLTFLAGEKSELPVQQLSPSKYSGLVISIGRTDFWLEPVITQTKGIRVALGLYEWAFERLLPEKVSIEKETKVTWEWKHQEGNKGPRIRLVKPDYAVSNKDQWREQHEWMKKHLELLYKAFRKRIQKLDKPGE